MKNLTVTIFRITCVVALLSGAFSASAQKKSRLTEEQQVAFERLYLNGAKEKILNNKDEAIKQFSACLLVDPENAAVYFNLAEIYLEKKFLADAEENINKAIALDKNNLWYRKLLGEVYEGQQRYAEAGDLAVYLSTKEDELGYLSHAAYLYTMSKQYSKAISALDKIEKKVGVNEEVIRQKEQVYLASNKLDNAIKEVTRLMKAYPEDMRFKGMLADLYMANDKTDKAVALYEEILAKEPGNGFAAFAMSDYYREKGDTEKWFSMLRKGMSSKDVDVKSKLRMIVSFNSTKIFADHLEKGHLLADDFIAANPGEATPWLVKGDFFVEQKKYREAHEAHYNAAKLDPSDVRPWQQMVFCSGELRDNELLQKDCEEAVTYFPNEVLFYFYHAVASMQLKQYAKAAASARKGIELTGEDNKSGLVQFYSTLGDASHYLNNNAACDSAYEKALSIEPENAYALNNYAYFLSLRKEKLEKAELMSKKSIELEPDNASYFDTYGWILYQKKDYEKAREYIERSLQMAPNNAEVVEHLGDVYYRLDRKDKAVDSWKRAQKLGSGGEFLSKKIKEEKLYE